MDALEQSKLFKTLMHPVRLQILEMLRNGEECVCHMEAALGLRQAYISQQLIVLREAGLVQDRREGWNIFYHVTQPAIYQVLDATNSVLGDACKPGVSSQKRRSFSHCECRKCKEAEVEKVHV